MELPRPRPFGNGTRTEGVDSTHDFLSLCAHSSSQKDKLPSSSQGAYLKTHDFLQPLERGGKTCAKEESTNLVLLSCSGRSTSEEQLLPGGIGTYSISQVPNFNQIVSNGEGSFFRVAQSGNAERNEDNSNCSSFHGDEFSLWDKSSAKMGKTGKENAGDRPCLRESTMRIQSVSMDQPSQSSSNNHHNNFSSLSSTQPTRQNSQSFIAMIKSARGSSHEGETDDDDEEFVVKKETSPTITGELRINVDGKSSDQKANTPRSKHSVTEQRRRSKINDRFQKLREIIPRSDQKRDKASFLLEVVEYIQFLQEKVHKYESSYQGWNQESTKSAPWSTKKRTSNQSQAIADTPYPTVVFADKFSEEHACGASQNPVDSETTTVPTIKAQMPLNHGRGNPTEAAIGSDKLKEQDLTIEAGTISISSVYSQRLLNSLTRALQSSGVDLSKASLSVQIELGKKINVRANAHDSIVKDVGNPSSNLELSRFSVVAAGDSERALKRLKLRRS